MSIGLELHSSIPATITLFIFVVGEIDRRSLSYHMQAHRYDQDADAVDYGKAWPAASCFLLQRW